MVIRLTSSKKGALNFAVRFESQLNHSEVVSGKELYASGYAPTAAKPNYLGDVPNAVVFDKDRGTRFSSLVAIKNTDGNISVTDTTVGLKDASSAIIMVSVATSFNGFDKDPATQGLDNEAIARKQMKTASIKSYDDLKKAHQADYQKYFNRVSLDLGATSAPNLPTDERLERYATGQEDKNLEILYFQYGRYLLISSSRTPGRSRKPAGNMESLYASTLEQQLYDQYQCGGKLLACRKYKSVGNAYAHDDLYKEHRRNRKDHCKDISGNRRMGGLS